MPLRYSLAIALLLGTVGCTTARINHFNSFAEAGKMYVTASQTVLKDAGNAAVDTDSQFLIAERSDLDTATRRTTVTKDDELLRQRLELLHLVSIHADLLQQYFTALATLADPKTGNSVGTAAQDAYKSLSGMSPKLKNAKIGGMSVSDLIPQVTAPIVAEFKVHALNQELHARADAITNELALQEAAFKLITEELKTDTQEQQNLKEVASIEQYAGNSPLPGDWAAQRAALLAVSPNVASAEAATKAATQLRKAFAALVENRPDSGDLSNLMSDISDVITTAQGMTGTASTSSAATTSSAASTSESGSKSGTGSSGKAK